MNVEQRKRYHAVLSGLYQHAVMAQDRLKRYHAVLSGLYQHAVMAQDRLKRLLEERPDAQVLVAFAFVGFSVGFLSNLLEKVTVQVLEDEANALSLEALRAERLELSARADFERPVACCGARRLASPSYGCELPAGHTGPHEALGGEEVWFVSHGEVEDTSPTEEPPEGGWLH